MKKRRFDPGVELPGFQAITFKYLHFAGQFQKDSN